MSKLDRFAPPTYADEIEFCMFCMERFHYTELDDNGFCADCAPEPVESHIEEINIERIPCSFLESSAISEPVKMKFAK